MFHIVVYIALVVWTFCCVFSSHTYMNTTEIWNVNESHSLVEFGSVSVALTRCFVFCTLQRGITLFTKHDCVDNDLIREMSIFSVTSDGSFGPRSGYYMYFSLDNYYFLVKFEKSDFVKLSMNMKALYSVGGLCFMFDIECVNSFICI